ncbi:type I-E CRISPR-associated protein Cas7/Cse4/CasC [Streptomyces sp. NPDC006703]|uniref:type I-E CRISPR-associated protein Cas7/Cse4/CasC n=1 Tax=Streptomyces sp. NPDC006703 TaxID=3364759 RepID=UPI0036A6B6AA
MALTDITTDSRLIDITDQPGNFAVLHTQTTFAGVSLNRDFSNLPKTLQYGDALRMRVSAQSKVRAARDFFRTYTEETAQQAARSRLLPQEIARRLTQLGYDEVEAGAQAALMVTASGMLIDDTSPNRTRAIAYVPAQAPAHLADLGAETWDDTTDLRDLMQKAIDKARAKSARNGSNADTETEEEGSSGGRRSTDKGLKAPDGTPATLRKRAQAALAPGTTVELAIFGRMLAELPDGALYSAAQVAHALSIDPIAMVSDDWTAKDDWQDLGVFGAAGKGTTFLASGTLYQYAALDRRALRRQLAQSAPAEEAEHLARLGEQLFLTALAYAIPSSARSRTGSAVPPGLVIAATTDHPLTAAACFEQSIQPPAAVAGAERLAGYLRRAQRHTPLLGGTARWLSPAGESCPELPPTLTPEDD